MKDWRILRQAESASRSKIVSSISNLFGLFGKFGSDQFLVMNRTWMTSKIEMRQHWTKTGQKFETFVKTWTLEIILIQTILVDLTLTEWFLSLSIDRLYFIVMMLMMWMGRMLDLDWAFIWSCEGFL